MNEFINSRLRNEKKAKTRTVLMKLGALQAVKSLRASWEMFGYTAGNEDNQAGSYFLSNFETWADGRGLRPLDDHCFGF